MESTIGLFKTELIKPRRPWKTLSEVELATAEWVDWYCHHRLHGEIGHIPPVEYETKYYSQTTKPRSQPRSRVSIEPGAGQRAMEFASSLAKYLGGISVVLPNGQSISVCPES